MGSPEGATHLAMALEFNLKQSEDYEKQAFDAFSANDLKRSQYCLMKAAEYLAEAAKETKDGQLSELRREKVRKILEKAKRLPELAEQAKAKSASKEPSKQEAPSSSAAPTDGPQKAAVDPEIRGTVESLIHTSKVTWEEIGGLAETKQELKYALGMTLAKRPTGVSLAGWSNFLLYGPPGTGKTLLAAAISNAVKRQDGGSSCFFNAKIAGILSKYFGESAKLITGLYAVAREKSPAVVFLDEFEALTASRDKGEQTGAERQVLSTFLSELDGLDKKGTEGVYVLTILATNRPWDLDAAILSRFEKKILIPLPDLDARREILQIHLVRKGFQLDADLAKIAEMTDGYSGRELEAFSKEVTNRMIVEMNQAIPELVTKGIELAMGYEIKLRALSLADFERARQRVQPQTTPATMKRYLDWRDSVTR